MVKAQYLRTSVIAGLTLLAILLGYATARFWHLGSSIFVSDKSPVNQLASLIFEEGKLIGEDKGQVNILLLGIGGAGHEGPYLSDTIIVASIKPATNEVALLSVPRDTLAALPGSTGYYKINHAYALVGGEATTKDRLRQARETVGAFTGLNIPYAAVIDFNGFADVINDLGGVDILIDKGFTDYTYPNSREGYLPPVTFKPGVEHMDGDRALIYARSRHSTSDFDRARRQQQIIEAVQDKAKNLNMFSDFGTINRLLDSVAEHFATNLSLAEMKHLAMIAKGINSQNIYSEVLDPTTGLMCSYSSTQYGYHLKLCPYRSQEDLLQFISSIFARANAKKELAHVEIQNTTFTTGLAQAAQSQLEQLEFESSIFTAEKRTNGQDTIVFDLTGGKKPNTLAVLLNTFSATLGRTQSPSYQSEQAPDFIVMLGSDYKPPFLDTINLDPPKPKEEPPEEEATETNPQTDLQSGTDEPDKPSGHDPENPLDKKSPDSGTDAGGAPELTGNPPGSP